VNEHDFEVDTLDLRDYIAVLRRRKWLVVSTIALVVGAAMLVTILQTPVYESSTRVMVSPTGAPSDDMVLRELVLGQRELETQREIAQSVPVAERVIERLELDTTPTNLLKEVRVTALRDTNILEIRVSALHPVDAARLSQSFAESYLAYRRDQTIERALAAAEDLEARTATIRERLNEIATERNRTQNQDTLAALDQEQQALLTQLGQIVAQQSALSSAQIVGAGGGSIIRPAEVPGSPASPKPLRNLALAIVLGGMLGVGVAFLRDFMDDALRSDEEAMRATGRPVLGHIPRWASTPGSQSRAITLIEPASPASEAFRTLRTNLRFLAVDSPIESLLVTSTLPEEGKTTIAANVAVAAARAGTRVLLVGADLRKPTIHHLFGMSGVRGLSDVLAQEIPLSEAIRDVGVTNLRVVPGGDIPPNPTEMLSSGRMQEFIAQAAEVADLVIYDGPPLLGLADALELAPRMDAVLLVVDLGTTGRSAVRASADRLAGVGANLAGTVLNRIDASEGHYGYYYAQYQYAADGSREDSRQRRKERTRT
jgi:polysaccharide biosynthesis transport protein